MVKRAPGMPVHVDGNVRPSDPGPAPAVSAGSVVPRGRWEGGVDGQWIVECEITSACAHSVTASAPDGPLLSSLPWRRPVDRRRSRSRTTRAR